MKNELNELFQKLDRARGQLYLLLSERAITDPCIVAETQRIVDETAHPHLRNDLKNCARFHLESMKNTPRMYAVTKEAFVAIAASWLDALFLPASGLYVKFIDPELLREDVTEEFGREVVDEVLRILDNNGEAKKDPWS